MTRSTRQHGARTTAGAPTPPNSARHAAPRRRSRRGEGRAGFTLIEVLLAIAIMVSLVVIVWGSIGLSFRSSSHMVKSFDQFQTLRLAMDRMTRELSGAYIAAHANRKENLPDPHGILDAAGVEAGDEPDAAEQKLLEEIKRRAEAEKPRDNYVETAFVGKSQEVHFNSMAHIRTRRGERASEQAEISYFVRTSRRRTDDGRLTRELVRREDTSLDDDVESGGVIYTLIDDVEEVEFQYWRPGKEGDEEDGGKWVSDWDSRKSELRGTLPGRVKITVTVPKPGDGDRDNTRTFTTQAQIMMTEILNY